jgi:hypothetical protein
MNKYWTQACISAALVIAMATGQGGRAAAQDVKESDVVARDAQGQLVMQDDRTGFGSAGQWTFSTDAALSFERRTQDGSPAVTTLSILPATDYFVIKNLSIGGVIGVVYQKAGETHATTFKVGPRIGYNIQFSRLLSLWPKLGFSYAHTKNKNGDTVTNNAVQLNLFAPIMVHPAPHFFVGLGPFLDTDLNGDNRATTWGFRLTLGGWI